MPIPPEDELLPEGGTGGTTDTDTGQPDEGLKARYDFQSDSDGLLNTDWSKVGLNNSATIRTTQTQNIGQVQEAFTNMPGAEQQSIFPPSFAQVDAKTYDELGDDDIPYSELGPNENFKGKKNLPQDSPVSADTYTAKAARKFRRLGADVSRILAFLASPAGISFIGKQVTMQAMNKYGFTKAFNPLSILGSLAESISINGRHFDSPGISIKKGKNALATVIGSAADTIANNAAAAVKGATGNPTKFTTSTYYEEVTKDDGVEIGANASFLLHETAQKDEGVIGDIGNAVSDFYNSLTGKVPLDGVRIKQNADVFHKNWKGQVNSTDTFSLYGLGVHNTLQVPYGGKYGDLSSALKFGTLHTFEPIGNQDSTTGPYKDFIKFRIRDAINGKWLIFPAHLGNLTDNVNAEYQQDRYIGRPDAVHIYTGTNRNISFDFRVAAFTKQEIPIIQEKMNYLVGLAYPAFRSNLGDEEKRPISPYVNLTIGDMFYNTPGYFSNITITVEENVTWETNDSFQIPQVFTVTCEFVYIGKHLPQMTGKHYDVPWLQNKGLNDGFGTFTKDPRLAENKDGKQDFVFTAADANLDNNFRPDGSFEVQTSRKVGEMRRKASIKGLTDNMTEVDEAAIAKAKEAANNDGTGLGKKFLEENHESFNSQMKQALDLQNFDRSAIPDDDVLDSFSGLG